MSGPRIVDRYRPFWIAGMVVGTAFFVGGLATVPAGVHAAMAGWVISAASFLLGGLDAALNGRE